MLIDIWSDIVCPWCYIGKRRFERALAAFPHRDAVEVVHRSFQLDPTSPRGQVRSHRDNLMAKYKLSEDQANAAQLKMERTAADEGLEFHLVGGVTGNTFDAHRLLHLAKDLSRAQSRDRGIQDTVLERFLRAHFTEQRSIFDHASLLALSVEAGLDPDEVKRVLADNSFADAVAADNEQARAYGASGVPFFVIDNRYGVSGAQPTEVFSEALARAWADPELGTRNPARLTTQR
jgi:predicted DsbA family dithiol-disulfide isomerase